MATVRFSTSITNSNSTPVCGATIINNNYVLTAASCFFGSHSSPFSFFIQAGIHNIFDENQTNQQTSRIIFVQVHPNYNSTRFTNDIALVRLLTPFNFNSRFVQPIQFSEESFLGDYDLVATGWGIVNRTNPTIAASFLQKRVLREDIECSCISTIDPLTQLCSTGTCLRDSGGPLMIFSNQTNSYKLVAIIGYRTSCEEKGFFTRIAPFLDWIRSIIPPPSTTLSTTIGSTDPPLEFICNISSPCGCSPVSVVFNDLLDNDRHSSSNLVRIVGGQEARPFSWPWTVYIRHLFGACAGSIINEEWILTAAHCFFIGNSTTIYVDLHDRTLNGIQTRNVVEFIRHPDFVVPPKHINDIALVRISPRLDLTPSSRLRRTCLPSQTNDLNYPIPGTRLAIVGWGKIDENGPVSNVLQQVRVIALDNNDPRCINSSYDQQRQFCALVETGGKDACQGDSGGPIHQFINGYWEQVGIISFGDGCAQLNKPGIYTRLPFYHDWIQSIINQTKIIENK